MISSIHFALKVDICDLDSSALQQRCASVHRAELSAAAPQEEAALRPIQDKALGCRQKAREVTQRLLRSQISSLRREKEQWALILSHLAL